MEREVAEVGANLFGAFNGVTHYSTHQYKGKVRQYSAILGTEKDINARGFAFIEKQLKTQGKSLITV